MMAPLLDTRRIRRSTPAQLRDYYRELLRHTSVDAGTGQILDAIERSSVSPKCFAAWLGVTKSPSVAERGLQQNFSIIVRDSSIKHLGRVVRSTRWKFTWDGLGGTPGLLELLSDLSVNEVRLACKVFGRCGGYQDASEKRKHITELFMGLQPQIFPDVQYKTKDRRPLGRYYRHLIPSCTEELVERIVVGDLKGKWEPVRDAYLMRNHPDVMRREQLRAMASESGSATDQKRFNGLVTQYPKAVATSPGYSSSMAFALQVLQQITSKEDSNLDEDVFINDLVRPLLRRAIRKGMSWPQIQEIVNLTMQYLEAHPYAGKEITLTVGDVHHLVAQCWAQKPDMFGKQLRKLCSDPVFGTTFHDEPREWEDYLDKIPIEKRYELFQLCFFESTRLDIDNDEDLKKVKGAFSDELFSKFMAQQALHLYSRLRTAKGDMTHISIWESNSVFNMTVKFQRNGPDLDLFHVGLFSRSGESEKACELAMQRIPERKMAAVKGSEPEQRTFYAQCALYYAVASGDLGLYRETLEWAQRFAHDPLVFRELYPQFMAPEVYARLTGIPDNYKYFKISDLRSRIEIANAVMKGIFDTACSAIREPSFQAGDWHGVLGLFQRVVRERIEKSAKLRRVLQASDEDMYEALWKHTLEMLLSVEHKAHQTENKRLNAYSPRGPLDCVHESHIELKTKDPAVYRFLDNLAAARNELWQEIRPSIHPAVLTLPKPLPRGLTVQSLTCPWVLDAQNCEKFAPYMAQRAKAALFPKPTETLLPIPGDEETIAAIGSFIDSYKYALRMYVPEPCSKPERTGRLKEPWNYAIGPLSHGRLEAEESIRFWADKAPDYLEEWPPCLFSDSSNVIWPLIPEVDDPTQRYEWNPFEAGRPNQPSRTLEEFTYLDASLTIDSIIGSSEYIWEKLDNCDPLEIPGNEVDINQVWHPDRNMGEGGVLSSLLYLEMHHGAASGSLLEEPFPSLDDPRYPALYLDGGFQDKSLNHFNAVRDIRGHLDDLPPALLNLSAKNMLAKMRAVDRDEHSDTSVQEIAITMVVRCAESDRPMIARDLVLHTIFDRPSASSWHRILLKPSFLRRLAASDAQQVTESFADGVWKQTAARKNAAASSSKGDTPPNKHIKITTIKLLSQLLQGTEFVDEEYAFELLITLLKRETHIDVRLNATKALLHMLNTPLSELAEKVLSTLETLIPNAGNLHELQFVSDQDWKVAEDTLALPAYPDIDERSPTTELFLKHYLAASHSPERRRVFVDRILLPTIACLQGQSSRWVSLFLKKHGIQASEISIPVVPYHASRMLKADNDKSCLPRSVLEELVSYATFKLLPPAPIDTLNKELKTHTIEPDVQTWFQLYALGPDNIITFRGLDIFSLFDKPTGLDDAVGITPVVVHEQFIKVFKACMVADAPLYNRLRDHLLPELLRGTYMTKAWWAPHGKPIVSEMMKYVESLRTAEWQRNPHRSPSVLPDTTPWRLLLLDPPYPTHTDTRTETALKCKIFAGQIAGFIEDIADEMYHVKLQHLKHFLALDPVSSSLNRSREKKIGRWTIMDEKPDFLHDQFMRNRLAVALELGTIRGGGTMMPEPIGRVHVLRVEVAAYLLGLVEEEWEELGHAELEKDVRGMVEEWRGCMDEGVRRTGWQLEWVFGQEEGREG